MANKFKEFKDALESTKFHKEALPKRHALQQKTRRTM